MGVKLRIVTNERLVVSTYYGEISDAEILGFAAVIRSDPDFDPSFSEIADFTTWWRTQGSPMLTAEEFANLHH